MVTGKVDDDGSFGLVSVEQLVLYLGILLSVVREVE